MSFTCETVKYVSVLSPFHFLKTANKSYLFLSITIDHLNETTNSLNMLVREGEK
jgi:hypothetical protein